MKTLSLYIIKPVILLLLVSAEPGFAQELNEGYAPIRAMGMGGASTATANDENSLWANPAGIARIRKARSRRSVHALTFPNLIVGINSNAKSFNDALRADSNAGDSDLSERVSSVIGDLEDIEDKAFWVRTAVNPLIMFEVNKSPIAFGLFSNTSTKAYVDPENSESTRVEVISDSGINIGFATSNRTNRLNFGFHLRPTYRYSFDDYVETSVLLDTETFKSTIEGGSNKAFGLGMDAGFLYTMADFWYPTIGMTIKNLPTGCKDDYLNPFAEVRQKVCGTTYTSGTVNNSEALSVIDPMDLRIGLSIAPRLSRDTGLRFAVGMHHIHLASGDTNYGLSEIEPLKTIHGGIEFYFGNPLEVNPVSFRLGINQGFVTTGASLRANFFTLEFASYGQDISTSSSPKEDRRYLVSFSFNL